MLVLCWVFHLHVTSGSRSDGDWSVLGHTAASADTGTNR